jgi:hypothetical protein
MFLQPKVEKEMEDGGMWKDENYFEGRKKEKKNSERRGKWI